LLPNPKHDRSLLFEIAGVVLCLNHIARFIVNADDSIVRAAVEFCVADCVADRVWLAIPQTTEWRSTGGRSAPRLSPRGRIARRYISAYHTFAARRQRDYGGREFDQRAWDVTLSRVGM
jgi:hypothetical protein